MELGFACSSIVNGTSSKFRTITISDVRFGRASNTRFLVPYPFSCTTIPETENDEASVTEDGQLLINSTLDEKTEWEVFSIYETDVSFNYIQVDFSDENEYESFLEEIKRRSYMLVKQKSLTVTKS